MELNSKTIQTYENIKSIFKTQQKSMSKAHHVFTKIFYKITMSARDDTRLQTIDKVTSYPYGTGAVILHKENFLEHLKMKNENVMMHLDDITKKN